MTAAVEKSADTQSAKATPDPGTAAGTPFSFSGSLRQFTSSVLAQGSQILSDGQAAVVTQAGNFRDAVSSAGGHVIERSSEALRFSLRALASDPEKGPGIIDEIVNLAPVLGTTRMYATAWQKFQHGTKTENSEMVKEAKRECLIALVNAGLDVTTLGVGALARTGFSAVLKGASAARLVIVNPELKDKLVNPVFDAALSAPRVEKLVTTLLMSLEPSKGAEQSAESASEKTATPPEELSTKS